MQKNIIAFIPARAGSKGLPGKNVRMLDGKPLYQHSLDVARRAGIPRVVVSTDIDDILETSHSANTQVLRRPDNLGTDETPMADVVLEYLDGRAPNDDIVVLLQPTSPLRTRRNIQDALAIYATGEFDLVMSVTECDRTLLKSGMLDGAKFQPVNNPNFTFENRQALPRTYRPNGSVYVFGSGWFQTNRGFANGEIGVLEMTAEESSDIDTIEDFAKCEQTLRERNNRQ